MIFKGLIHRIKNYRENRKKALDAAQGKYLIMDGAKIYPDVSIGKYSYVAHHSVINHTRIGNYTSIGPHCTIGFGDHPIGLFSLSPFIYNHDSIYGKTFTDQLHADSNQVVSIGHDVWIGSHVVVKNGVTIGNGAIIGAGALVLSDVEPFSINVGVPAKQIRKRFTREEMNVLEELKWWDLDPETLSEKIKRDQAFAILRTYQKYKV